MDIAKNVLGLIISGSTVLGIFTGIVNKVIAKKIQPISDKIDKNERENLEHKMQQWRFECVTFASNLRKGVPFSIYEFQAIFVFADKYEQAVKKLDLTNNLFEEELTYIRKKYQELTEGK